MEYRKGARNLVGKELAKGSYIKMLELTYVNDNGDTRKWECAERTGGAVNAVSIFALKKRDDGQAGWNAILTREFRPPVGAYCIGNPAGLIEPGESAREAAIREVREETGYEAEIVYVGYPTESTAGLTGELVTPVVAVLGKYVGQDLDEGESIETIECPLDGIEEFLNARHEAGDCISGRLLHTVIGMKLSI